MSNRAWVTLATNDSYGLGALVLAYSLRRVGSVHPAVVLITPAVTEAMRERLGAVFAQVVTVDVLDSRDAAHLALLQRPQLGITFTKIHCWNLTQYEKCVFLDADTLVVQNCDELFERDELSAAPDVGWPDCFNSGVFVYKPSQATFDKLIKFAGERGSFDGGDQGLLNTFFSDWARGDISKHLPFLYNVTSAAFYSYLPALKHYGQNLKIIHFIGATKPWLQKFNWDSRTVEAQDHLRELLQLWWDLFVSQIHPQLDVSMVEVEEDASQVPEAPPVEPPQDVFHHYAPQLDPESEFPWHHPDARQTDQEITTSKIDMTQIHDPWEYYTGNIPFNKDDLSSHKNFEETDNDSHNNYLRHNKPSLQEYNRPSYVETGQTIWHEQSPQLDQSSRDTFVPSESRSAYVPQQNKTREEHHVTQHWQSRTQHIHTHKQEQSQHHQNQQYHPPTDSFQHSQYHDQHDNISHTEEQMNVQHDQKHHWHESDNIKRSHGFATSHENEHEQHQGTTIHSHHEHSVQQHHYEHLSNLPGSSYHEHNSNSYYEHQHSTDNFNHAREFTPHTHEQQHSHHEHGLLQHHYEHPSNLPDSSFHDHDSKQYHHEHHDRFGQSYQEHLNSSGQLNNSPHPESAATNVETQSLHSGKQSFSHNRHHSQFSVHTRKQPTTDYIVYHVHLDYIRLRNRGRRTLNRVNAVVRNGEMNDNGDGSDTDNDDYEDIIPRHPYDGFYLRHRATIDSRGHKRCTHEIPPTPTPSPPDTPPPFKRDTSSSDEYLSASDSEVQSGVAGNLARVVPGAAGFQREALDELTRRQGWEAGNIDYMGADSFDNIWAKISQTLCQPRSSPPKDSPPKEPTPPPKQPSPPPKQPSPPPKQPSPPSKDSPPKEPTPLPKQPSPPKEQPQSETVLEKASETKQPSVDEPVEVATEAILEEAPLAPVKVSPELQGSTAVKEVVPPKTSAVSETPVLTEVAPKEAPAKVATPVEAPSALPVTPVSSTQEIPEIPKKSIQEKTVSVTEAATPPASPKPILPASTPIVETPPVKKVISPETTKAVKATPPSATAVEAPTSPESTPEKRSETSLASTDSPPLANTPSKEDPPPIPAAKSEQRRKPAGKLQLAPPATADPLPTPDSELEDAASLAHAIIASELAPADPAAPAAPAVFAAPAAPAAPQTAPAAPKTAPAAPKTAPVVPKTAPAAGAVSLAQIGVKPTKDKTTIAAQIESSISDKSPIEQKSVPKKKTEASTPAMPTEKKEQPIVAEKSEPSTPTPKEESATSTSSEDPPKKARCKIVKKKVATSGEAPVPPPRSKEKKPKEK